MADLIDDSEELIKQKLFIDSLDIDDRRRQLYYSQKTPWQFFLRGIGWINGSACDAEENLFVFGRPIRLGEWEGNEQDNYLRGLSMINTAQRILEDWTNDRHF